MVVTGSGVSFHIPRHGERGVLRTTTPFSVAEMGAHASCVRLASACALEAHRAYSFSPHLEADGVGIAPAIDRESKKNGLSEQAVRCRWGRGTPAGRDDASSNRDHEHPARGDRHGAIGAGCRRIDDGRKRGYFPATGNELRQRELHAGSASELGFVS